MGDLDALKQKAQEGQMRYWEPVTMSDGEQSFVLRDCSAVVAALCEVAEEAICRRFTMQWCKDRPELPEAEWCAACRARVRLDAALGETA